MTEPNEPTEQEYIRKLEADNESIKTMFSRLYSDRLAEYSAIAMQGFCANPVIWEDNSDDIDMSKVFAQMAVKQAKALIAELEGE